MQPRRNEGGTTLGIKFHIPFIESFCRFQIYRKSNSVVFGLRSNMINVQELAYPKNIRDTFDFYN